MNRAAILEVATYLGFGAPARVQASPKWITYPCPFAKWKHANGQDRDPSFGIHVNTNGESFYSCFSCKEKGPLAGIPYKLGRYRNIGAGEWPLIQAQADKIKEIEILGEQVIPRPYGEKYDEEAAQTVWVPPNPWEEFKYPRCIWHPYTASRGIDLFTGVRLKLRYDPFQRRVLFPLYEPAGRFAGFSGRRIDPPAGRDSDGLPIEQNGDKYIKVRDYNGLPKRKFFLGAHRISYRVRQLRSKDAGRQSLSCSGRQRADCVLINEGSFDFATLERLALGYPLSNLGSGLTDEKVQFLKDLNWPIVNFFDNDDGGKAAWEELRRKLWGFVPLLNTRYPDGYEGCDPSQCPDNVLIDMFDHRELVLKPPM